MKHSTPLIMGKNCIREVLRHSSKRLLNIYTLKENIEDPFYKELVKAQVPIKHVSKNELSEMVDSTSHQSFVAAIKQRDSSSPQEFLKTIKEDDACLVLMLDSIFDPHNFGAILRAAECFNVACVLYSKNRGGDVTAVAAKVSSGASELVPLIKVSNLAETAKLFQEEGFTVISADVGEGSKSLDHFTFPARTLLILGSEGEGIQPLLKKRSDIILKIPMYGKIDSLNVSQAAAVFLFAYRAQLGLNVHTFD